MLRPVPARASPEPARVSLANPCENLATAGKNLQTADLSHFPCGRFSRFRFQASIASHDAAPIVRTAGEGLEPARLRANSLSP
jgi:hypothetical protein